MLSYLKYFSAVLLLISLSLNYFFYKRAESLNVALNQAETSLVELEASLKTIKEANKLSEEVSASYAEEISKLTEERNLWRRKAKSRKATDKDYQEWTNNALPKFVIEKYNYMSQ